MTRIFVFSSHDFFASNNCATVAAEDKDESFFEEEEEEDAGVKEGEEEAADINADEPAGDNGEAYAPGHVQGGVRAGPCARRRMRPGLRQGGECTRPVTRRPPRQAGGQEVDAPSSRQGGK